MTKVSIYTAQPTITARGTVMTTATGSITLGAVVAGNTVGVAGVVFTAVAASATPTAVQFVVGATPAASATNLAAAVNAHATVKAAVTATPAAAVITVTGKNNGVAGNYVALATNSAGTVTLSGATLTGGAGTGKAAITVAGLQFKDLNGNGTLEPYEDWRLLEDCRAQDLVTRLNAAQKIGLMSEGGSLGNGVADGTIPSSVVDAVVNGYTRQSLIRPSLSATQSATYINHLNELAESLPLGIPVVITSDPAHASSVSMSASGVLSVGKPTLFTPWPGYLGLGAINDPSLTYLHANMVRQEFMATGFRWQLGPMADLATEPRWNRVSGLFGSNANLVSKHIAQMVSGFQGSITGDLHGGIAATMKHFPGHGPEWKGMDGHSVYGRFTVYPGNNFAQHLVPFQTAFTLGAAAIMPNYTIQKFQYALNPLQVPTAFDYELVSLVAKKQMGFRGLVTNDWCTMGTCGIGIGGNGYNMEGLTYAERAALHLHAGSHQLGNEAVQPYADALTQKLITDDDLSLAAIHVLTMSFKLGLFENPYVDATQSANIVRSAASRALGFEAMKRSIVLLKNADHISTVTNRYLPINGTRATNDTNATGSVEVYYDGQVDSIVAGVSTDDVTDLYGAYDYTSAAAAGALAVAATTDITKADIAVLRIVARNGAQTAGIPLSFDGILSSEELNYGVDSSLAAAAASKKKVIDAFRVRDGYKDSTGATIAPTNPTLKIVLVVTIARPAIVRGFVSGLVSLDELAGQPGSYPSVADEANIRQAGQAYVPATGGGVDALLMEFGSYDRAVLDFLFNAHVPTGVSYGAARLPMEMPSSDSEVAAQYEDLPDDTWSPTYRQGDGLVLPAN